MNFPPHQVHEESRGYLETPDAFRSDAPGSSIFASIAAMASRLNQEAGCALLLLEEDGLQLGAERHLTPEDRSTLALLVGTREVGPAEELVRARGGEMRSLVTQDAELVGALVLFGCRSDNTLVGRELQELEWMATIALEQRHLLEDLRYRAHHDSLTRLWNRLRMEEEIAQVTAEAQTQSQPVALSVLGIDSLRMVNEVLGHDVGNELLQQVSVRLARMKRPEWELARTGGDEFTLLIPSVHSESEVEQVASLITETFEPVFRVGEHELFVRASGGMAISPGSASAEELQSQANVAFRYAKKRKRGRMAMFHPSMATTPPERFALEQHLRFALQKNEFELYYQPQIELQTGKLVGAEALLRWRHPAMGFIAPSKFIPLAEEIGVIEEIGDWTIDEALRYASTWKKLGLGTLRVAVNVSGIQFARADFASLVARRLHRTDIDPQDLELEITETVMMTNFEHVARQLKILRSLGVQIAIDDFGTGHSSLAYLQQLPVHRLKIDQMFVRNIVDRDECPPLLSSIINMSHALELSVIAEGVETEEQLALLARLGCDEIQGYLISKPISGMELMALAREENWMPSGAKEA